MAGVGMKVLITAGGTGGHVFPALAVAADLRAQQHTVIWLGTPQSFEAERVPAHGYPIEFVKISALRGKGFLQLLLAPLRLLQAVMQARAIIKRVAPDVVLGMGGFVAGPGGLAARTLGVPLVIHEQNAAAGLTNRALAKLANTVLQAFPQTFATGKTVGNPVRAGFADVAAPAARMRTAGPLRILVVGGSQGAKALNQIVPQALALIPAAQCPQVVHQAGKTLDVAQAAYAAAGVVADAQILAFISDMPAAFAAADLVVCRAGASTIAELAASGAASILVPFPFAVDDHQTANARFLVDVGAARLMPEASLTPLALAQAITTLADDRKKLIEMAQCARKQAWTDSVRLIVDALKHAANSKRKSS